MNIEPEDFRDPPPTAVDKIAILAVTGFSWWLIVEFVLWLFSLVSRAVSSA